MSNKNTMSVIYSLQDKWVTPERTFWAWRGGDYATLTEAKKAARALAKGIGKGAHVRIVATTREVVCEVKS